MFYRDFSSSRGFRFLGYSRHNAANKTLELIKEGGSLGNKTVSSLPDYSSCASHLFACQHKVCAVWTKRQVYWHEVNIARQCRTP